MSPSVADLGLLRTDETHRLKLKRPLTAKKYRKELDELYAEALAQESANPKARL